MPNPDPVHSAFELVPLLAFAGHPELLERFGLSRVIDHPNTLVPHSLMLDVIEAAVEASGDPYLGLHFGASHKREWRKQTTPLAAMMSHAPDMRTGISRILQYKQLWNTGDRYEIEELGSSAVMRYLPWGPLRPGQIQMIDKTAAQFAGMIRFFGNAVPEAIRLAYPRRPDAEELALVLGVAPTFDASATEVMFPSIVLGQPARSSAPAVFEALDGVMRDQLDRASSGDTLVGRVRTEVLAQLASGGLTMRRLAEKLGCSSRTLQRQLDREGITLRVLLEEVRRTRADSLIGTAVPLAEVARLLDYSDRRAFHAAFRRWFGVNPGELRTRRRGGIEPDR